MRRAPAPTQEPAPGCAAGEVDTLAGVDKAGMLEKYIRDGAIISAIKAHRRFYGTDIGEADKAVKLLKYDMQLREENQPTYDDLRARLAAAEALASTNAALLTNAQSELNTRIRELAALEEERNRLRGAVKMLLASLHNIRDMRVNPMSNDDFDRGRRDGYRITAELAQAAINAHAKAANALAADGEGA
jgi:hypothetical protein